MDFTFLESEPLLDQKGCKPKCRFSQVLNHCKSEVDPQEMIRHKRIIEKKKKKEFAFGFHSKVEQRNII
jgi:hypothetical protein